MSALCATIFSKLKNPFFLTARRKETPQNVSETCKSNEVAETDDSEGLSPGPRNSNNCWWEKALIGQPAYKLPTYLVGRLSPTNSFLELSSKLSDLSCNSAAIEMLRLLEVTPVNSLSQTWMPSFLWSNIGALPGMNRFVGVFPRKVTKSCATPPQLVAFKVVKWWTVMVTNVLAESVFLWIIFPMLMTHKQFYRSKLRTLFCLFSCFHPG